MSNDVMDVTPEDFNSMPLELNMYDKFSTKDQYNVYPIKKKSGGVRMIEAPSDELKAAQRASLRRLQRIYMNHAAADEAFLQYEADVKEILEEASKLGLDRNAYNDSILDARENLAEALDGNRPILQISHMAHAFARERNISSGAKPHVGQEVVLTVDLSDFFPSIKWSHFDPYFGTQPGIDIKWESKSYKSPMQYAFGSKKTAMRGAFMHTYINKVLPELKCHFCDFGDGKGLRLPQGAPGSPFLSNVLMCRMDYRAAWRGYPEKVQYTRYADDMVFSGADEVAVKRVYSRVVALIRQLGLSINKRKYTLKKGNQRKKVLGLVVNALPEGHSKHGTPEAENPRLTRYFRRRLRAMKHHCRVIHTLETLGKERGFKVPPELRPFFLSKTEGMSFGDKMRKMVEQLQNQGANISMDDLQSKKLLDPPRWYSRKIAGHAAFEHMIDNPPQFTQDSVSFCAAQEILAMA